MKRLTKIGVLVIVLVLCMHIVKEGAIKLTHMMFPLKYEDVIEQCAEEYNLDKNMVIGVIYAESKFFADAHSGVAKGLMQLTDETAREVAGKIGLEYNEDMTYNPEKNIKMGCYYLAYLKGLFKDTNTALAAYNAGPGKVREWLLDERFSPDGVVLSKIPYPETKNYVERVHQLSGLYQKLY